MTKQFDAVARTREKTASQFFEEPTIDKVRVRDMKIRTATSKEVRGYIAAYHYSNIMPDSSKEIYVGFYDGILAGICVFAMGVSVGQFTRIIPDLQDGEYRELTRLWSPDSMPKNTESKLIAESIKRLPKEVKLLISYADTGQCHLGIIYQATNWIYTGMTNAGTRIIDKNGITMHTKTIETYRRRHPELKPKSNKEIMKIYNWESIPSSPKHRYIKILGSKKYRKKILKLIEDTIKPYPKC